MSEKTPRMQPHHSTTMIELARKGAEFYHYPTLPRLPLSPDQQRKAGQLSLSDVVPETPDAA